MTLSKVVIDTNIVSYLMKGHPIAHLYKKHLQGKLLSISFMTVGELYYGAEKDNGVLRNASNWKPLYTILL